MLSKYRITSHDDRLSDKWRYETKRPWLNRGNMQNSKALLFQPNFSVKVCPNSRKLGDHRVPRNVGREITLSVQIHMMLGREFSLGTYELHHVWCFVITATKLMLLLQKRTSWQVNNKHQIVDQESALVCAGTYTTLTMSLSVAFVSVLRGTTRHREIEPTVLNTGRLIMYSNSSNLPLQAWRGPEVSRRLRLPDFKTIGTWRW